MKIENFIISILLVVITIISIGWLEDHRILYNHAYIQGYTDAWLERHTKPSQGSGCNYGDIFYDCERNWILTNNVTDPLQKTDIKNYKLYYDIDRAE